MNEAVSGKYEAYPEYKDSGVEWIGSIPIEWGMWKLNHAYYEIGSGTTPPSGDEEWYKGDIPWVTTGELKEKEILSTAKNISENSLRRFSSLRKYPIGSIAIAMYGATIGRLGILGIEATTNQACCVLTKSEVLNNEYLYYWLQAFRQDIINLASGGGQPNINQEIVASLKVSAPAMSQQNIIATFLTQETTKIDTLIQKQQQLIKLLKEKRQAVISHAVTKGLNPNAPMRDSGVEWLGEVPEGWEVTNLRYLGICQNGINIGAEYFGSGYSFVSYGDVYKNEVLPDIGSGLVQSTELDRKTYSVMAGDILFTRTSETVDEIGFSSVCLSTIENATFAGFLIRFRPSSGVIDSGFSKYYFRNKLIRAFFIKEMNLVTRASLSQDLLKKLPVVLPSIEEQKEIAEFLDKKSSIFKRLTENAELAIQLMKERRTALISAAVTGKIDVRNFTPDPKQSSNAPKTTNPTHKEVAA